MLRSIAKNPASIVLTLFTALFLTIGIHLAHPHYHHEGHTEIAAHGHMEHDETREYSTSTIHQQCQICFFLSANHLAPNETTDSAAPEPIELQKVLLPKGEHFAILHHRKSSRAPPRTPVS